MPVGDWRRKLRARLGLCGFLLAAWLFLPPLAGAGPWAEPGDAVLRSDIQVLASAGVIDDITMQWPLPWARIVDQLNRSGVLRDKPYYVREAARRVLATSRHQVHMLRPRATIRADFTTRPGVVRAFDAIGRAKAQGAATYEYTTSDAAFRLAIGAATANGTDTQSLSLDDSYAAVLIGPAIVYAGYPTRWWGPGWISSMTLSNNARPLPQIGISRADTSPLATPWLSWLGPWQADFFVGLMNGPRIDSDTGFVGFRLAFNPFDDFEIGISRTTQICGQHHTCDPLFDYVNPINDNKQGNNSNDQLSFDFRYGRSFANWGYETYFQVMNEDNNPIVHSGTNKLVGFSLWSPVEWGLGRLIVEFADSRATNDIWGGGRQVGFSYNNISYFDGMRYRGRTLGFSLDSDSRLISVQAAVIDDQARSLTLTYHHADVSSAELAGMTARPTWTNVVSSAAVTINTVEAHLTAPVQFEDLGVKFDLLGRLADDQPRPKRGATAAIELRVECQF